MSESHSTAPRPRSKPAKPYEHFPLFPHATYRWAKKIRGKMHYFGPWEDPDGALAKYLVEKDDLHAGRKPREVSAGVTIKAAANAFLNAKQAAVDSGELSPRTWDDYRSACELVVKQFGKGRLLADIHQDDFAALRKKLGTTWGHYRLGNFIQYVRCLFRFAYETEMVPAPIRFGPGFKRPSKKTLRLHRAAQGPKLFTADEVHQLLGAAGVQVKAMILLGGNAGLGNGDCSGIRRSALDLDAGWLDYPRPKTGIARRCPLWPETVEAIRAAMASRPAEKDQADADLVFITKYGESWGKNPTALSHEMKKLLGKVGINGHRNFYTLRHTFRTVADAAKDQPAADHIMGHESPHMSSHYREGIDDARLRAVADHVRAWLFGNEPAEGTEGPAILPMNKAAAK